MNRRTGVVVIVAVLVVLALVASRAFEERSQRLAKGQSGQLIEAQQKTLESVPLWRQR